MDQPRVELAACHREVANRERVDQKCSLRLFFSYVDLVVSGRVDHKSRIVFGEHAFDVALIGDVDPVSFKSRDFVAARFELLHELEAELSSPAENRNAFAVHHSIIATRQSWRRAVMGSTRVARRAGM